MSAAPARPDGRGMVPPGKRKILYCGTDIPTVDPRGRGRMGAEDLVNNLDRLRKLPFDGIAVNIWDPKFPYPRAILGNNLFSSARQDIGTFTGAIAALKELGKTPLRDNFLLIASGYWFESGKRERFDWFDEARWSTVENNLRVYTQIARRAGTIRGLILDAEPYHKPASFGGEQEWAHNIFSLSDMYNLSNALPGNPNPWQAYLARVRDRGRRFFRVIEENLPGAPILLYLAYGMAANTADPTRALLLPVFLDGVLEEIESTGSKSYLIDGTEGAYKLRGEDGYTAARTQVRTALKNLSTAPQLYERYVRIGFGKWLDAGGGDAGVWDPADVSKNYYSPAEWERSLRAALKHTDEYVWIWSGGAGRIFPMSLRRAPNVPEAYLAATRRAKRP